MPRIPTSGLNSAVAAAGMTPGTTYYLSAHSADPGTTGASELSGGGYAISTRGWAPRSVVGRLRLHPPARSWSLARRRVGVQHLHREA